MGFQKGHKYRFKKGHTHSAEIRAKISATLTGRKQSPTHIANRLAAVARRQQCTAAEASP